MHIEHWSMQSCIADMSIPVGIDMDFIMSAVVVITVDPVFSRSRGVPAGHLQRGPVPDRKYGRAGLCVGSRFPSSPHSSGPEPEHFGRP